MSLLTSDYDFSLPEALIASRPAVRRQDARMMILNRERQSIEHGKFEDFPALISEGDLVVLNDTKVLPARLFSDDGRMELLLIEEQGEATWKCLVRPGRRLRTGKRFAVGGGLAEIIDVLPEGERVVRFHQPPDLEKLGHIPLPPYLRRESDAEDAERYQTVYSRNPGAIAAPTAGLHFTPEILAATPHVFITLHVGAGTFKPVKVDSLVGHRMDSERFFVSEEAAGAINRAGRLVAVGTTTVRVLEHGARQGECLAAGEGRTDIFIHPPFEFRAVDALLTNFHLPKSTLLMLVSAFAGREFVLEAYAKAVEENYRFYSYGDCMFIR
jgi:S-adenosylmethionine:tRNA ribosyltransferase-isomerase